MRNVLNYLRPWGSYRLFAIAETVLVTVDTRCVVTVETRTAVIVVDRIGWVMVEVRTEVMVVDRGWKDVIVDRDVIVDLEVMVDRDVTVDRTVEVLVLRCITVVGRVTTEVLVTVRVPCLNMLVVR